MRHEQFCAVKSKVKDDIEDGQPKQKRFRLRNMFRSHKFIPYFQEKGLTIQDLPKAIVCHELMGYCMLGITWAACYHFPISGIPFFKAPMEKVISFVPKALSDPVAANPFLCSKYGKSYMESTCLRKLLRPITLPGKLYLTYKMVQVLPDISLPSFCTTPSSSTVDECSLSNEDPPTTSTVSTAPASTSGRWKLFQRQSSLPSTTVLRGGHICAENESCVVDSPLNNHFFCYKGALEGQQNDIVCGDLGGASYVQLSKIGENYGSSNHNAGILCS